VVNKSIADPFFFVILLAHQKTLGWEKVVNRKFLITTVNYRVVKPAFVIST
jgi:hypothetical protein